MIMSRDKPNGRGVGSSVAAHDDVLPAQRLRALQRPATDDIYRSTSAVAVLDRARVYVVIVKSAELAHAGETALRHARLPQTLERNAVMFSSLDVALVWANAAKWAWLSRG